MSKESRILSDLADMLRALGYTVIAPTPMNHDIESETSTAPSVVYLRGSKMQNRPMDFQPGERDAMVEAYRREAIKTQHEPLLEMVRAISPDGFLCAYCCEDAVGQCDNCLGFVCADHSWPKVRGGRVCRGCWPVAGKIPLRDGNAKKPNSAQCCHCDIKTHFICNRCNLNVCAACGNYHNIYTHRDAYKDRCSLSYEDARGICHRCIGGPCK